ncbi:hypothetical protein MMC19_001339 [Ptychographa xylographoides]|nr:hypothetical protein [Ptychographa xylographoides]
MSPIQVPICYASCSIGTPEDPLPAKLNAISAAGFDAIELSMPDLLSFANSHFKKEVGPKDYDDLCKAGKEVKKLCAEKKLKILVLQPFANFEGWAKDSEERRDAFERAEGWIRIMDAVGTDMLQVGSSDSPTISGLTPDLARDLAALADLLAEHSFRLAYENWCWATRAPTWRNAYDLVLAADRPNIGLCLDTFQTAGSEWADPTTASGLIEDGGVTAEELKGRFEKSLRELREVVPAERIYFLQISDAYRMQPPMEKEVGDDGLRPRGRWSHDWRPLPFDGGYLPVVDVAKAVLGTGFRGWFSTEVFDGKEKGRMGEVAEKAMRAHERLMREVVEV